MQTSRSALDLTGLALSGQGTLTQQLVGALRRQMLQGRLPDGARLPTTRALAQSLGLSRNTVVRAYERLLDEGLIASRTGDGSYVNAPLDQTPGTPAASAESGCWTQLPPPPSEAWLRLQDYQISRTPPGATRAFRWGSPAVDLFPADSWRRLQARCWRSNQPELLGYGDPAGDALLRQGLAEHLRSTRGLNCSADQILITSGAQQAISLLALALLGPGDEAAVETPGYRSATAALSLYASAVRRVPLDAEGLRSNALRALGPRCRLLYLTPSHQFPTGIVMSLARRLELLAWAREQQGWIIEDDYDSEYRYTGLPLPPLASLDTQQRTLYVGSLSKLLFPGLRLGYLVAPAHWLPGLTRLRAVLDRHSPGIEQRTLALFIAEGQFLRHLRRMRRAASERREVLLESWQRWIEPLGLPLPAPDAGLHAFLPLPDASLESQLAEAADAAHLEVGTTRRVGAMPVIFSRAGLLLGFAALPPASTRRAVQALAQAWAPLMR